MDCLVIACTEKNITAALFSFSGRQVSLKGAESFELSPENDLSSIAATIGRGLTGTPRIVLCLPPAHLAQRLVSLPLSDLHKVREVLPHHLQGEISSPTDELVFDALPVAEGSFLALWAKKTHISSLIEIFRNAGCEPHHVSSMPCAWSRLPGLRANDALFDGTTLALMSGGRLSMLTSFGAENGTIQLRSHLAAVEFAGATLPERLVLLGDASDPKFDSAMLQSPTATICLPDDLGRVFKNEETYRKLAGLYAVASACHDGSLADFRRGELAYTQTDAALRKKMITTGVLMAVVILLLFGARLIQYRTASADIASLDNSISVIYKEIFPGRPKAVDELAEVKGEIRRLAGTGAARSLLDLLKALADARGVKINGLFEAELDGTSVRLKGDAPSAKGAADFKAALADILSSVQLGETRTRPDGTVSFTVTGTLKEEK